MASTLEQLRRHSVVVADSGDFRLIAQYAPRDATTNPSLILKAVQQPAYGSLLTEVIAQEARGASTQTIVDALLVRFGVEILRVVEGRVSTEVDARLSFDRAASIARARGLIARYEDAGVARQRVLIKLASTWEGLQAARVLEADGIRCNLTLLFAYEQALAAADAQVTLISPFVGRILDWHKARAGATWDDAAHRGPADPGVQSVRRIFAHYKANGIRTEVMGASFRNVEQILALAGCDLLTISPDLLTQLQSMTQDAPLALDARLARAEAHHPLSEAQFRWGLNEDEMASSKLAEGIRAFAADARKLDQLIQEKR